MRSSVSWLLKATIVVLQLLIHFQDDKVLGRPDMEGTGNGREGGTSKEVMLQSRSVGGRDSTATD